MFLQESVILLTGGRSWSPGGRAWFFLWQGGCVVFSPEGGMCGFSGGACVVFLGGMHVFFRGRAWFFTMRYGQ